MEASIVAHESCGRSLTFDSALEAAIGRTGILPPHKLEDARRQSAFANLGLRDVLIASGQLAEDQVNFLVGEELRMESVHITTEMVDPSLVHLFPADALRRARAIPVVRDGDEIVLAMADPTDDDAITSLGAHIRQGLRPVIGRPKEILDALAEVCVHEPPGDSPGASSGGWDTKSNDPSGVVFLYHHLERAHAAEASEIHIDPGEAAIRVRYRVGAMLRDVETQPRSFLYPLLARVRILAGLPQSDGGRGQTGSIRTRVGDEERQIEVTIAPTPFGESAVIRFQAGKAAPKLLDSWGFTVADADAIRRAISEETGLVLLSSPNASIRKDLAYSLLMDIDSRQRKICTLERGGFHPVERFRQLTDATLGTPSVEVALGLSPDVFYLEDTWDTKSAASALQACMGRMLLVTGLPYPATLEGLVHLADAGVPHPLLGRALRMAIAVRRHRRLCANCRVAVDGEPPSPAGARPSPDGCEACEYTGYRGNVSAYETLLPSGATRDLLCRSAPWSEVAQGLEREGWTGMGAQEETLIAQGVLAAPEV